MTREAMPARRRQHTVHAKVDGSSFFLSFGEYEDGRLGEVWLEAAKEGTFLRGIVGALARVVSVAIQCGTPVSCVVVALRELNFPPHGTVIVDGVPGRCTSVVDWVAQEIQARYIDERST